MIKVRAKRGVCIGVERHLAVGECADLDAAMVTFLTHIGAVEVVKDEPEAEHAKVEGSSTKVSKKDK
jgi:hypothetical protein